jgi:hypothetical protein
LPDSLDFGAMQKGKFHKCYPANRKNINRPNRTGVYVKRALECGQILHFDQPMAASNSKIDKVEVILGKLK